jgi:hypothetical protein
MRKWECLGLKLGSGPACGSSLVRWGRRCPPVLGCCFLSTIALLSSCRSPDSVPAVSDAIVGDAACAFCQCPNAEAAAEEVAEAAFCSSPSADAPGEVGDWLNPSLREDAGDCVLKALYAAAAALAASRATLALALSPPPRSVGRARLDRVREAEAPRLAFFL